jgi:hypothetical protein
MVKAWFDEPGDFAVLQAGTKHLSWRRALARQHSKQDTLSGRAEALRHETQFPEHSLIGLFSKKKLSERHSCRNPNPPPSVS